MVTSCVEITRTIRENELFVGYFYFLERPLLERIIYFNTSYNFNSDQTNPV